MTEMSVPDLCIALAKVEDRLDRYIMKEVEDQSMHDGLKHYIDYVQVQRDIIKHIQREIKDRGHDMLAKSWIFRKDWS